VTGAEPPSSVPTSPEDEIRAIVRDRKAAALAGDVKAWGRNISPDAVWVDAGPKIGTTADVEKDIDPAAPARADVKKLDVKEILVRRFGDTAVATYLQDARSMFNGKEVVEPVRYLDTYVRLDGRWQLVASSEIPIPVVKDPTAIKVKRSVLDRYVGTYEVNASRSLRVWREGDTLMAQDSQDDHPDPLLAESETTFFAKGMPWRVVFVKNAQGKVGHLVVRNNGLEFELPKVK
jgi:ketosteroid isomerase-like protein